MGAYWALPRLYMLLTLPVILTILILIGYSFYLLLTQKEIRVWLFVITLTFVTVAIFLPADLIFGGIRSINTRYMIPCYLGMQISVAYFFTTVIIIQSQKLWRLALVVLLSIGIMSDCLYLPAETWWNKERAFINISLARTINSASKPLLVADFSVYSVDTIGILLGLSYQIDENAKLLVFSAPKTVEIPNNFNEIFLYDISPKLKTQIEKNDRYRIQKVSTLKDGGMLLEKIVDR